MSPPLRRGRALARQRLVGLLFLAVLTGLVASSISIYTKAFTPTVDVMLKADRVGNQLGLGADVKARGVIVGEVREISSDADSAQVLLALDPDTADRIPTDTRARLLPKTLFGEKFVALVFDDDSAAPALANGDVIAQDRTSTARETSEALDNLLPLLRTLQPEQVSTTLNALSTTLRGRGERVGDNLVLARDYLREFNPELPVLAENFRGLADFADNLDAGADDIVTVLDNVAEINRDLVETEGSLEEFLRATTGVAGTAEGFVAENADRFITLPRANLPVLDLFERYTPQFPCLFDGLVRQSAEGERVFGGLQPGLHITAEVTKNDAGYQPGDEPLYGQDSGPTCFGLDGPPIIPFPIEIEVTDGYCDDQEQQPGIQDECERDRESPLPGPPAAATPFSPASYDRAAVGLSVAPALGLTPAEVPDVAVLLFAPVARS